MKIYAYIGLVLALISYSIWSSNKERDAGYQSCVATYESELRVELIAKNEENNALNDRNNKLVLDLLNKQPEIRIKYKEIEKRVNVYVKVNTACNLTFGAIQLRNQAGDPEQLQPGYHSDLSESNSTRASTVTQRAAEKQVYQWGKLYTEARLKYKTLLNVCENNNNKTVE